MRSSFRPLAFLLMGALTLAGCVQESPEENRPPTTTTPSNDDGGAEPSGNQTPDDTNETPVPDGNETAPTPTPPQPAVNRTENVTIIDDTFSPGVLYVKAGTTVTWTNQDRSRHTVTDLGGDFDSGSLSRDDTFSHVFSEKGEFFYLSQLDTDMQGRVVVE